MDGTMALQKNVATPTLAGTGAVQRQLTAAQLLGMSDEHYMGAAQKQSFRTLLVNIKELLEERGRGSAAEIAIGGAGADPIDRASAEEEHQLAMSARARDAAQLIDVRAALERIEADEFGWCIETGEMIGIGRLLICPTATLCFEAQQRLESKTSRFRS